jgi:hypothetical protein
MEMIIVVTSLPKLSERVIPAFIVKATAALKIELIYGHQGPARV